MGHPVSLWGKLTMTFEETFSCNQDSSKKLRSDLFPSTNLQMNNVAYLFDGVDNAPLERELRIFFLIEGRVGCSYS